LALRGLVRRSTPSDDTWRSALSDTDVDVRREALTQVATVEVAEPVVQFVRAALSDSDALVVEAAVFALGEFLDDTSVSTLCQIASTHEDARCREAAIAALGAIGDDHARSVIIGALDDKPPVRRRAIVALANFEGPDIEAALERASDDRDWQVRAAVSQLGREVEED
jgi:HEAT repeat protein